MEENNNFKWVVGIIGMIVSAAIIFAFLQNIDLTGTSDTKLDTIIATTVSIDAEVEIVEEHLHNRERWFGIAAPQTATNWGEEASLAPYRAISGAGIFGADPNDEALVIGVDDTPTITGMLTYDAHRIQVTAASNATDWVLRIIYGMTTMVASEALGQYTDVMIQEAKKGSPVDVLMPRTTCASCKVWVRAKNAVNNATIDFFIGIHEYPYP